MPINIIFPSIIILLSFRPSNALECYENDEQFVNYPSDVITCSSSDYCRIRMKIGISYWRRNCEAPDSNGPGCHWFLESNPTANVTICYCNTDLCNEYSNLAAKGTTASPIPITPLPTTDPTTIVATSKSPTKPPSTIEPTIHPSKSPSIRPTLSPLPHTTSSPTSYSCSIFSSHFTNLDGISPGIFQDDCGTTTLTTNSGDLTTNLNERYQVQSENDIVLFRPSWNLTGVEFIIVIEGRRTVSKTVGFDIILGPTGTYNCQIRYEGDNDLCIYSNYDTWSIPSDNICITLPEDIDTMNRIILYNTNTQLNVYQNGQFVATINKPLDILLGLIGGWHNNTFPADIAVKNIMLAINVSLATVTEYI